MLSRLRKKWVLLGEPDMAYNRRCVTRCWGRPMRGGDARTEALFSYVSCEARVPMDHPLRAIGKIVNEALTALSPEFEKLYAKSGRPSIPPEKLLRALLLQAFYSVRSERQLMEQLDYNLLFRWFVGLSLDAVVWDVTVFTKNRERLIAGRHRCAVHGGGAQPGAGQDTAVGRAFLGGRHADRGVGRHQELSSQRRQRRAAGARPQRRAGLSWREAQQRDPRLDH